MVHYIFSSLYNCYYISFHLDDVPPAGAVHEDGGPLHQLVRPGPGVALELGLTPLAVEQRPVIRREVGILKQSPAPAITLDNVRMTRDTCYQKQRFLPRAEPRVCLREECRGHGGGLCLPPPEAARDWTPRPSEIAPEPGPSHPL